MVAAVAVSAALMVVTVPGTGHAQDGGTDKVTLCHQTGNGSYETITVSASGAENGHGKHDGDIIPAPAGGCPTGSPAPATPSERGKVLVCHLTGNGGYTVINIAQAGWENGHSKHEGDILLLDDAGTESCTDARVTLDAAAAGTAGVAGVDVESLVPAMPDSAPQDGHVTICHMTGDDGYVKITIAQAGWDNGHSKHEGDIMLTGSSASASCDDALITLDSAAAGRPGVAGIDVASLVPAAAGSPGVAGSDAASLSPVAPTAAADPVLPSTGAEHTMMLIVAALALLSGLGLVRVGNKRVAS